MSEFSRFIEIFGINNSRKKTSPNIQSSLSGQKRKRKSLDKSSSKRKQFNPDESLFQLSITRRSLNKSVLHKTPNTKLQRLTRQKLKFDSPDKQNILEHLSCGPEQFSKDLNRDSDSDDSNLR